jgi:hypothetical protein
MTNEGVDEILRWVCDASLPPKRGAEFLFQFLVNISHAQIAVYNNGRKEINESRL